MSLLLRLVVFADIPAGPEGGGSSAPSPVLVVVGVVLVVAAAVGGALLHLRSRSAY